MAISLRVSPIDTVVFEEDERVLLWQKELRDVARGFTGALFVALPLLYTMEMWEIARALPQVAMAGGLVAAYFANVGYSMFGGFKPEIGRQRAWIDGAVSLAIGVAASALTLALIGRYTLGTPLATIADLVALEAIPASFGASIAIKQLGTRYDSGPKREADRLHPDVRKLLATALGALLFSFNIAPTVEPRVITTSTSWWLVLALAAFSLAVSALMTGFSDFVDRRSRRGGLLDDIWLETAVSYLVALAVSAALLWFFAYIGPGTPLPVVVKWTVVLGYVTSLGGSAGRLIL